VCGGVFGDVGMSGVNWGRVGYEIALGMKRIYDDDGNGWEYTHGTCDYRFAFIFTHTNGWVMGWGAGAGRGVGNRAYI
jgi:hypothetical protein